MQKKISCFTNYFKVDIVGEIYKYDLIVDDTEIPDQATLVTNTLFKNKENRQKIVQELGANFLFLNNIFYSMQMMPRPLTFDTQAGVKIHIQYDAAGPVKQDTKTSILGRLLKVIQ